MISLGLKRFGAAKGRIDELFVLDAMMLLMLHKQFRVPCIGLVFQCILILMY